MNTRWLNLILVLLATALVVFPLIHLRGAGFEGADAQAEAVIAEVAPGYQPWMKNVWEPPSPEIETLLFSLQAAVGAGIIGYSLGYMKGRKSRSISPERRATHAND